jgi:hypothetical protein
VAPLSVPEVRSSGFGYNIPKSGGASLVWQHSSWDLSLRRLGASFGIQLLVYGLPDLIMVPLPNESAPANSRHAWHFQPFGYFIVTRFGYVLLRRLWLS